MQDNTPKIHLAFSVIFLLCSSFVFVYFYRATQGNNQKSEIAETEWQNETLKRNDIKALDHSIKIIEKERGKLDTHFAESSDIVPFLDTLEGLAPKVGIKAEVTSVDILADHTGLVVGMKASGSFGGLYKFLTLLENSSYELEFVSVEIHRGTPESTEGKSASIPTWAGLLKLKLLSFIP